VAYERTVEIALATDVKVQFSQSGRPIDRYAVVLMMLVDAAWETVRVYDNHLGTHHMHRYTRSGGKQEAAPFKSGPTNEVIPAAIAHLKGHWQAIIESWDT
jgi:hypothetical protein